MKLILHKYCFETLNAIYTLNGMCLKFRLPFNFTKGAKRVMTDCRCRDSVTLVMMKNGTGSGNSKFFR